MSGVRGSRKRRKGGRRDGKEGEGKKEEEEKRKRLRQVKGEGGGEEGVPS